MTVLQLAFDVMCLAAFGVDGMQYPLALAVDRQGAVFIADRDVPGVWKFADGKLGLYYEGKKTYRTPLNAVRCLAIDVEGKLLAGDSATREIYRFDDAGQPVPLTKGEVGIPMTLAVAKDGRIYASDLEIQRIVSVPAGGGEVKVVAEIAAVRGMAFDGEGRLWVAAHGKDSVIRFSTDFTQREVIVPGRAFQFSHHLVFDGQGMPAVTDGYAKTLYKIVGGKTVSLAMGDPFKNPVGLAWTEAGWLVADPQSKAVFRVTPAGQVTKVIPAP